jgi:translation initiation factor 1
MGNDDEVVYDTEFGDLRKSGGGKKGGSGSKNRPGGKKSQRGGAHNTRSGEKKRAAGPAAQAAKDGTVRVTREKKGRGGKTVTVVYGLSMPSDRMEGLAAELKKRCGAGGTVKGGTVEVQGDNVEAVIEVLGRWNIRAKQAGG